MPVVQQVDRADDLMVYQNIPVDIAMPKNLARPARHVYKTKGG
jgi:hypothetical protein